MKAVAVRGEMSQGENVKTLARGLDILGLFGTDRPELTQSQIAGSVGLPLPTVGRLCRTLIAKGFLAGDDASRRMRLGPEIVRLGLVAPGDVLTRAKEWMGVLAERFGEQVNLAVLDGTQALYIDSVASRRTLSANRAVGTRAPAHCTAVGKCLLAQLDVDIARDRLGPGPYERRTSRTLTEWSELAPQLESIRAERIARSFEEFEDGLVGVAVLLDAGSSGHVYGVSIAVPSVRARPDVIAEMESVLRAGLPAQALVAGNPS